MAMARSPSSTCTSTPGWLSAYVEKVCVFFVGNAGVALDQRRHDATGRLEPKGQRGGVDHEEVVDLRAGLPREDSRLHRRRRARSLVEMSLRVCFRKSAAK